jgi:hypothetical protein
LIIWVIAGLLGLATGLRIGWALVNKQSLVSTAMILALGCLGLVAALNWQPLTLLIDTVLHWPNISMGLSQVALIGCAAGSCVMITTVASERTPATIRKIAMAQYGVAGVIAVLSLVIFFGAGQQPEMSPEEYLKRNLASSDGRLPWLLPLLYVFLALTLVSWAGMRHSNRSRRGRALFVFTIGIVLIVLASAFFLLRAAGNTQLIGVGAAATLLGCAMLVVAAGSLLPSVEDWFGARYELRTIQPVLAELGRRHPDVGIDDVDDGSELESPPVSPREQARTVAQWIYDGREDAPKGTGATFPGLGWLRQPASFSDREWILEIAQQYRELTLSKSGTA